MSGGKAYFDPNTIPIVGGRVEAAIERVYIEAIQKFRGNPRIELRVEKVGDRDHSCWAFVVELTAHGETSGIT